MILSNSKKFIFIHVPKAAGTSMNYVLWPYESLIKRVQKKALRMIKKQGQAHVSASVLRRAFSESVFNSYFKFAFVRNPWDWQVSLYEYMKKSEKHYQHKIVKYLNFGEYLEWRVRDQRDLQKDFICDENNKVLVDFVGKYENLQEDFNKICDSISIPRVELPHKNRSEHKPYQEYYNEKTKNIVAEAFKDDIEIFNYTFENE